MNDKENDVTTETNPRRVRYPTAELPIPGETSREAQGRRERNRLAEMEWRRFVDARCGFCGQVRTHVNHEEDPTTAPEGADYFDGMALHHFVEPS